MRVTAVYASTRRWRIRARAACLHGQMSGHQRSGPLSRDDFPSALLERIREGGQSGPYRMSTRDALEGFIVEGEHVVSVPRFPSRPMLSVDAIDLLLLPNPPRPFHGVCTIGDQAAAVERMAVYHLIVRCTG